MWVRSLCAMCALCAVYCDEIKMHSYLLCKMKWYKWTIWMWEYQERMIKVIIMFTIKCMFCLQKCYSLFCTIIFCEYSIEERTRFCAFKLHLSDHFYGLAVHSHLKHHCQISVFTHIPLATHGVMAMQNWSINS